MTRKDQPRSFYVDYSFVQGLLRMQSIWLKEIGNISSCAGLAENAHRWTLLVYRSRSCRTADLVILGFRTLALDRRRQGDLNSDKQSSSSSTKPARACYDIVFPVIHPPPAMIPFLSHLPSWLSMSSLPVAPQPHALVAIDTTLHCYMYNFIEIIVYYEHIII